ncbi:hypothetical protein QWY82_05380 [Simiduia curdlanivorans]|uniref:Zf-HC2 domain-containing protein n=1 Tax=Simiduia curdlanivorans TaxID=1492769 RepID=A0ABV8V5A2_9GAMM|nr:hypothetical protein [Simiduia curdlanivorans]MDN3638242.1 hypothetical protein [Simiduia curdlanivorans]
MLTCKKIVEQSSEYREGNMTLSQRLSFKLHLYMCLRCRRYLKHFETTIAVASQCAKKSLPEVDAQQISNQCKQQSRSAEGHKKD